MMRRGVGCLIERVKLSSRDLSFDLAFRGRYSILTGLSGTGKTRLVGFLHDVYLGMPVIVEGGHRVVASRQCALLDRFLREEQNSIIVIDEDIDSFSLNYYLPKIKASSNFFIFIGRGRLADLPYGVDNVFEMTGGPHHYKMIPKYSLAKVEVTADTIICEDSGLGFELTDAVFGPNGTRVVSACGKECIAACVRSEVNRHNSVAIAADLCGTGIATHSVMALPVCYTNVKVLNSQSFESELLRSQAVRRPDLLCPSNSQLLKYTSEEEYYVDCVHRALVEQYGFGYAKAGRAAEYLMQFFLTGKVLRNNTLVRSKVTVTSSDWLYPGVRRAAAQRGSTSSAVSRMTLE